MRKITVEERKEARHECTLAGGRCAATCYRAGSGKRAAATAPTGHAGDPAAPVDSRPFAHPDRNVSPQRTNSFLAPASAPSTAAGSTATDRPTRNPDRRYSLHG